MFVISKFNALEFKARDGLLPNWENTLSDEVEFDGSISSCYVQKFLRQNIIKTQIKTDYDSVSAFLFDDQGGESSIPVNLIYESEDELTGFVTKFFQFDLTNLATGTYYVDIRGVKAGDVNQYHRSEKFEIVQGEVRYRRNVDGVTSYRVVPNHLKVSAKNTDNRFDLYFQDGFSTEIWIPAKIHEVQTDNEIDVYDNNGNLTKLKEVVQNAFTLKSTEPTPRFLAQKIQYLAGLSFFEINDILYVSSESGENEYFGNLSETILTMTLVQQFAVGVNSDNEEAIIKLPTEMDAVFNPTILGGSGNGNFVIPQGYRLIGIVITLASGTEATVTIGTQPAGTDILRATEVTSDKPHIDFSRNFSKEEEYTLYYSITGVSASVNLYLNTIRFSQ